MAHSQAIGFMFCHACPALKVAYEQAVLAYRAAVVVSKSGIGADVELVCERMIKLHQYAMEAHGVLVDHLKSYHWPAE
jgi:hypothetical protein